jgi:hypothetical protein
MAFSFVTLCSDVGYQHFREPCCLQLEFKQIIPKLYRKLTVAIVVSYTYYHASLCENVLLGWRIR